MLRIIIFILLIVFCFSCGLPVHKYDIEIQNIGNKDLYEVEIESRKGFWFSGGVIIPGSKSICTGPMSYTPRDIFTVCWITTDREKICQNIDLTEKLPMFFSGVLRFKIDTNNNLIFETK